MSMALKAPHSLKQQREVDKAAKRRAKADKKAARVEAAKTAALAKTKMEAAAN